MSTAWPERGFSTKQRIKTKTRNKLLNTTLNALLTVSLNGPSILSYELAMAIADKWLGVKIRRDVTSRHLTELAVEKPADYSDEEDKDGAIDEINIEELEMDRFWL